MIGLHHSTLAVAVLAATLYCSSGIASAQSNVVKVFTGSTAHWADLVIGIKKGFFDEEGIKVEPTYFTTGAAATESFIAGRGDIVLTCELASIGMWKRGNVVGISKQATLHGQEFLVVREGIEEPGDLKGKTLATRFGSTVEYFLRKYLQDVGIAEDEVEIINLEPADMVVALDSGDIDGYSNYIPFPQLSMRATGGVKVLATSADHITENCLYSTTRLYSESNQDELVAFLRGIQRAAAYVEAHPEEAAAATSQEFRGKEEHMRLVIDNMEFGLGYTAAFRSEMQAVSDFFELGEIQWDTWFDPKPLQKVAPEMVELPN